VTGPAGRHGERGAVAGLEGVMFALLVLVTGTVLVSSAWSVLQVRRTLDGAAREYLRAYTEADGPTEATESGSRAARAVLEGERPRRGATAVSVDPPDQSRFGPCDPATVSLSEVIPAMRLPFVGSTGEVRVRVTHTELVDAHREMRTGSSYDRERTPCAD